MRHFANFEADLFDKIELSQYLSKIDYTDNACIF